MRVASDDSLMQAAAGGDPAAFAVLMQRHRPWVRSLLESIVQDREHAEDLTQDVFCRLYRQSGRYAATGQFVAWLRRIAVNLARDHLRGRRRSRVLPLEHTVHEPPTDPRSHPESVLESQMLQDDLKAALQSLPEEQRRVLLLHYFAGLNVQEIAEKMGCPAGTVKSRLFHGRLRVRQYLTRRWQSPE